LFKICGFEHLRVFNKHWITLAVFIGYQQIFIADFLGMLYRLNVGIALFKQKFTRQVFGGFNTALMPGVRCLSQISSISFVALLRLSLHAFICLVRSSPLIKMVVTVFPSMSFVNVCGTIARQGKEMKVFSAAAAVHRRPKTKSPLRFP